VSSNFILRYFEQSYEKPTYRAILEPQLSNMLLINESQATLKKLRVAEFPLSKTGVNHRKLTIWESKGLLPSHEQFGKWRKFSLVDCVWIRLISKMRSFGIGLDSIKDFKEAFFGLGIWKMTKENEEARNAIMRSQENQVDSPQMQLINSPQTIDELERLKVVLMELLILDILDTRQQISLLIDSSRKCFPFKFEKLEQLVKAEPEMKAMLLGSHISLSLSEVIGEIVGSWPIELTCHHFNIISPEEAEVLKAVRQKGLKSVIVKFDADSEIEFIEEVSTKKVDPSQRISHMMFCQGSQEITIKTHQGKVVHCENKKRKRVK